MDCPTCGDYSGSMESVARHHGRVHPDEWEDRFWMYVDRGEEGECWEWCGQRHYLQGHGRFKRDSDYYYAHRVSYRIECGEIENQINHTCDNPPCVNPNHLYDGTQKENVQDAIESGNFDQNEFPEEQRGGKLGEKVENSKLEREDVVSMRNMYEDGWTQNELADEFPVNQPRVSMIVRGEAWPHVGGPTN